MKTKAHFSKKVILDLGTFVLEHWHHVTGSWRFEVKKKKTSDDINGIIFSFKIPRWRREGGARISASWSSSRKADRENIFTSVKLVFLPLACLGNEVIVLLCWSLYIYWSFKHACSPGRGLRFPLKVLQMREKMHKNSKIHCRPNSYRSVGVWLRPSKGVHSSHVVLWAHQMFLWVTMAAKHLSLFNDTFRPACSSAKYRPLKSEPFLSQGD